jgi:pimeloyl-ACP methyl ester carboxylesterase
MLKQVRFSCQGQNLYGSLHLPEKAKAPFPAVLLCHGFTGTRFEPHRIFLKMSRLLEKQGIASLRFDFLGHGESDGEFKDIRLGRQVGEAAAGLAFLRGQRGVSKRRCGLLGLSMGGAVSASLAGKDPDIGALVLWNAVATPERQFRGIPLGAGAKASLKKYGGYDLGGNLLGRGFFSDLPKQKPLERLRHFKGKALIVQGLSDSTVVPDQGRKYAQALGARGELHLVEGGTHTFDSRESEGEALTLSLAWLKKNL